MITMIDINLGVYIDNKNNPINYSMRMDLKRGYSTGNGENINGWVYIKIESSEP